jgi:regulator of nonsense transcripts 1
MVKCITSGKWFCNGRIESKASCIINHLIRSKNHEVQLNRKSPMGEQVLECFVTGFRNVFNLGFISMKKENTVVLLSHEIIVRQDLVSVLKDLNLNFRSWQPLIQDQQFVHWLVTIPDKKERLHAYRITPLQMHLLEKLWQKDKNATTETLEKKKF